MKPFRWLGQQSSWVLERSEVTVTAIALFLTIISLQLVNRYIINPQLAHLRQGPSLTYRKHINAVASAWGDRTTGRERLPLAEFQQFPAKAYQGSYGEAKFSDVTPLDETTNALLEKALHELRSPTGSTAGLNEICTIPHHDSALSTTNYFSIVWTLTTPEKKSPDKTAAVSIDEIQAAVLEISIHPEEGRETIRFQVYLAVSGSPNGGLQMIGRTSPEQAAVWVVRENGRLYRPVSVSYSETEIAERLSKDAKRIAQAANLKWKNPSVQEVDRVTNYCREVLTGWTSEGGTDLHSSTALARFLNGPNYTTGWVQFAIQFMFWVGVLNLIFASIPEWSANMGLRGGYVGGFFPVKYALWAMPLTGTLGTMIGMASIAREIGKPTLNLLALSDGLSVAYDTTALALLLTIPLMLIALPIISRESDSE